MGKLKSTETTGLEVPPRHMFLGVWAVTVATSPERAAAGRAEVVKRSVTAPPAADPRAEVGRSGGPTPPLPTPSTGGIRRSPEEDDRGPSRRVNTAVVSARKRFRESKGSWEEGVRIA